MGRRDQRLFGNSSYRQMIFENHNLTTTLVRTAMPNAVNCDFIAFRQIEDALGRSRALRFWALEAPAETCFCYILFRQEPQPGLMKMLRLCVLE